MRSLLGKIIKTIAVFIGGCMALIALVALPVAIGVMHNEIRLVFLKEQTKKYVHPSNSQLLQKISLAGNFARASNQCGFIVAEIRTTEIKPDDIRIFYAPILTDLSYDREPPHKNVTLYIVSNKKDVENIELFYPDVYERMPQEALNNTHAYLLIAAETGYPPNYDPRCH